jgi:hypothetical protein
MGGRHFFFFAAFFDFFTFKRRCGGRAGGLLLAFRDGELGEGRLPPGGDPDRESHLSAKDQVRWFRSSRPSLVAVAFFLIAHEILLARQLGGGAISTLELHIRTQNQKALRPPET